MIVNIASKIARRDDDQEQGNGQSLDERRAMEHGQASAGEVGLRFWVKVEASVLRFE